MPTFTTDSLVHSKIPKQKKRQGDSRIQQLIGFAKATGVQIDNLKTLYAEGGGFKGLFKKIVGSKQFRAGLGEMAAYGAGIVAEGASGGTVGVLAGIGYEAAALFGKATGQDVVRTFKPGQWVAVDNGEIHIKKAVQRGMDWTQGAMFGGEFPIRADEELETERLTSIGFAVGEGAKLGTTKVFNFETGDIHVPTRRASKGATGHAGRQQESANHQGDRTPPESSDPQEVALRRPVRSRRGGHLPGRHLSR